MAELPRDKWVSGPFWAHGRKQVRLNFYRIVARSTVVLSKLLSWCKVLFWKPTHYQTYSWSRYTCVIRVFIYVHLCVRCIYAHTHNYIYIHICAQTSILISLTFPFLILSLHCIIHIFRQILCELPPKKTDQRNHVRILGIWRYSLWSNSAEKDMERSVASSGILSWAFLEIETCKTSLRNSVSCRFLEHETSKYCIWKSFQSQNRWLRNLEYVPGVFWKFILKNYLRWFLL